MNSFPRQLSTSCVLFVFAAFALALAFQLRSPMRMEMGVDNAQLLGGFTTPEHDATGTYRWTYGRGTVIFPSVGQTVPLQLTIRLNAWRPDGAGHGRILVNNVAVVNFVSGDWMTVRSVIKDPTLLQADPLTVRIESDTFSLKDYYPNSNDTRELGTAIRWVQLQPLFASANPVVMPPIGWLIFLGAVLAAAYWSYSALAMPKLLVWFVVGATLALYCFTIAFARLQLLEVLMATLVVSIAIAALALLYAAGSMRRVFLTRASRVPLVLIVAGIVVLAGFLRWTAMQRLPPDIDEQDYVPIGAEYARLATAGEWGDLLTYDRNIEHPVFVKMTYGAGLLVRNALSLSMPDRRAARLVSAGAGTALVALVTLVNPLGGLTLAVHTMEIKYVSEAYLEAIPALFSALAAISYQFYRAGHSRRWWVLSAFALGVTAASKYPYLIIGAAILPFLIWDHRQRVSQIFLYGALAFAVFFLLDPIIWIDPLQRLSASLLYNLNYTHGTYVADANRPWWWELHYLTRSEDWDEGVFLLKWDTLIFALSLVGLPFLASKRRLYFLWYVLALAFLLVWPTKWPQYTLILTTPMCLAAGYALKDGFTLVIKRARSWRLLLPAFHRTASTR